MEKLELVSSTQGHAKGDRAADVYVALPDGSFVVGSDSISAASDVAAGVASCLPANCSVSPTLLSATWNAGSAATAAEQRNPSDFTRREQNVNAELAGDGL
jgi:hypothetical protein